ncbi:hypothetical protein DL96DRAFT_422882 [Flagelloscypha sp. PMI_526]|nr:hypothetical protein DL96DRAFT_422882 [Flagelloscypha sp. PMI_526]
MVLWRLTLCFTLFTLLSSVLSVKVDDLYGDENTGENKPNFVGDWGFTTGLSGPNGIDCTNCDSTYRGHPSEYGKPYKGTWHSSLNKDPVHTPYVELNFEGTSVTVYGVFSQKNEVQVKIVVDGKPFPDFVYDPPMNQVDYEVTVVVFEKKDLSPGSHTIVLSNLDGVMFSFDSDEHSPSPQSPPENTPAGNGNSTQSPDNGTGSSHNGPTQSPDNGTGSSNNNSTQSPDNGTGISNSGPTQSSDHGTGSPSSTSNISSVTSSLLSQNVSTTVRKYWLTASTFSLPYSLHLLYLPQP